MKIKTLLALLVLAALPACTENDLAKNYGGSTTIDLPANTKFVNATWKDVELWYVTKPMTANDTEEVYTFQEKSSFGIWEGTVTFREHKTAAEAR